MLAGSRDQAAGSRRNGYVCDCHLAGDERASRASARRLTPRSRLGTARAADGGLEPPSLSFLFEIGPADLRLLCVTWTPRPRTPSWRPASCPRESTQNLGEGPAADKRARSRSGFAWDPTLRCTGTGRLAPLPHGLAPRRWEARRRLDTQGGWMRGQDIVPLTACPSPAAVASTQSHRHLPSLAGLITFS